MMPLAVEDATDTGLVPAAPLLKRFGYQWRERERVIDLIIVSSGDDGTRIIFGLEMDADEVIAKPARRAELNARIPAVGHHRLVADLSEMNLMDSGGPEAVIALLNAQPGRRL
ncbi:hypothetical protein FCL40_10860 [Ferrimonas sediminicola]|uniref:Response regulatory domain-containing protein n=1 Tax=Ferrimonas sediminicola TaxID=2569538 RepID=A0A4U1BCM1_9GAMM|nr:hypothetical protein [Ferrimonas sediminicola]TKB48650.1 hypothetical protein FCL40_10860 [Ferrimonas sediminicola]